MKMLEQLNKLVSEGQDKALAQLEKQGHVVPMDGKILLGLLTFYVLKRPEVTAKADDIFQRELRETFGEVYAILEDNVRKYNELRDRWIGENPEDRPN